MTEGFLKNKYEKQLKIYGSLVGFNLNSNYMFYVRKIISVATKILKKYKKTKEEEIVQFLDNCISDISNSVNRMYTLNNRKSKEEMRIVIESKMSEFAKNADQLLNEK
jgi:hypothetical protein